MTPGPSFSSSASPSTWANNRFKQAITERDVFWHPSMTTPPPNNYTPGLIPVLKACLIESHSRGDIRKAVLCYERTVFIKRQLWDAHWGCGYRNFLMACAVLMVQPFEPMYFPLIDEPIPPGIRNLQQWIEIAWDAGFDAEGKRQLKKLLGTSKWIGTSDIWVAFSSRGIPAELADFDTTKQSGLQPLVDWVVNYFTPKSETGNMSRSAFDALKSSNSVISTELMPLILQHSGHSRLVIGYEIDKKGKVNFLTFDSAFTMPKELRDYALSRLPINEVPTQARRLKRQASDIPPEQSNMKRSRSEDEDDDIEIVAESNIKERVDDEIFITGFSSSKKKPSSSPQISKGGLKRSECKFEVDIQPFRITPRALRKHKQYQILYFPMTSPLTERERSYRRIPTSTKVS